MANLDSADALKQIEYMRSLVDQTRGRAADGHPWFLLWGAIWVAGYLGSAVLGQTGATGWLWFGLIVLGSGGSVVIGMRAGRKGHPPSEFGRKLRDMNIFLVVLALGLFVPIVRDNHSLIAYIPGTVGVMYILNGIFIGWEMAALGGWILAAAIASLFLAYQAQVLLLAVAGGGGLLTTGFLLRRQLTTLRATA